MAKNDITGDSIRSKAQNEKYSDGWDRIFGKKSETKNKQQVEVEDQKSGDNQQSCEISAL